MYDNNPFRLAKQLVQEANKQFKTYENCLEYYMDKGLSEDAARKECNAQEAENIGESNERLAKQDPREFGSEPFDQEDMADLRRKRSVGDFEDHIHHLNDQHIMHTLAASDPNKSAEERKAHKIHAIKYAGLRDDVIRAGRYEHIRSSLRTDPREVPTENQSLLPYSGERYGASEREPIGFDKLTKESEEIENLLDLIEALCEELDIDSDTLLEGYGSMTKRVRRQYRAIASYSDRAKRGREERSALDRNHTEQDDDFDIEEPYQQRPREEQIVMQRAAADPRNFPPGSRKTPQKIVNAIAKKMSNKVPKEWQQYKFPSK